MSSKAPAKLMRRVKSVSDRTILEVVRQVFVKMNMTKLPTVITPYGKEMFFYRDAFRYRDELKSEFRKKTGGFRDRRVLELVCIHAKHLGLLKQRGSLVYEISDAGHHILMTRRTGSVARSLIDEIEASE